MIWNDQDVIALVIAARAVAFDGPGDGELKALDAASEKFAAHVPWDDEPTGSSADTYSEAALPEDIILTVNGLRMMLHLSVDLETGYPDLTDEDKNIVGQFILSERNRSIAKANEVANQHNYASEAGNAARTIINLIQGPSPPRDLHNEQE